jgi:glycerol-3-phosphate O-acyltransferase
MKTVGDLFADLTVELQKGSVSAGVITPETVYQPANMTNRKLVHKIAGALLMSESRFENLEALLEMGRLSREGKSCLILMEHYSNLDIPNFFLTLERLGKEAEDVSNQIIAIAGAKLNEESLFVRAFTEAYSRIVSWPPRGLEKLRQDPVANADELAKARAINMASLHQMVRLKHAGHIILVFPSGTRYRPGEEDTKRGLREMDSYLKSFDHLLFIGMTGNTLRINPAGKNMAEDTPARDAAVFVASDIVNSHEFRKAVRPSGTETDPKQAVADAIMAELEKLHAKAQAIHDTIPGVTP